MRSGAPGLASLILTLPFALTLFSPAGAAATPSPTMVQDRMSIDLTGLEPLDPQLGADLARQIHSTAAVVIAQYGVPAAKIHLAIRWRDVDAFDYETVIELDEHQGQPKRRDVRSTGPDAEQGELGEVVEASLRRELLAWTRERDRIRPPEDVVESESIEEPPPRDRALGTMGWLGVGALAAGVCSLGAGIGLLVLDTTPHPDQPAKLRSWQPGGIGLSAVGGVALVTGAALVGVDGRRHAKSRRAAVSPWTSRRMVGVTLHVVF